MSPVLLILVGGEGNVVPYAGDVAIVVREMDASTLRDVMQTSLRELTDWTRSFGLGLNLNL